MSYKLADTVIDVDSIWPAIHRLLQDYKTDDPSEFKIMTDWPDIRAIEDKSEEKQFSAAYYEMLAVHCKLSHELLDKDILLFHGSALAMDGQGYIFTAPSGTGKSTHARLWREHFGERVTMVNDDKPFLKIGDSSVTVYGSPWDGKHRLSKNTSVPLKAIAILERAEQNSIERVEPSEAVIKLLQQSYREEDMEKIFPLVLRLAELVPIYRLRCNMDPEAAIIAYEGMQ